MVVDKEFLNNYIFNDLNNIVKQKNLTQTDFMIIP